MDRNSRFSHHDEEDQDAIAEPGELTRGSRVEDDGAGVLGVDVRASHVAGDATRFPGVAGVKGDAEGSSHGHGLGAQTAVARPGVVDVPHWHRQQVLSPIARRFLTQVSVALEEDNTNACRQ